MLAILQSRDSNFRNSEKDTDSILIEKNQDYGTLSLSLIEEVIIQIISTRRNISDA